MITTDMVIIFMVLTSMLGPYGMIFLKIGSKSIRKGIMHPIKNYHLVLGLGMLIFSFALYVFLLRFGDITTLYPITALGYVWIVILSIKYFKERMNPWKLAGISLIMLSVILIALGK